MYIVVYSTSYRLSMHKDILMDSTLIKRKDNKIYYNNKLKFTIVPDETYPKMFKLRWPDKVLSENCYNLTRTVEHARRLIIVEENCTEDVDLKVG